MRRLKHAVSEEEEDKEEMMAEITEEVRTRSIVKLQRLQRARSQRRKLITQPVVATRAGPNAAAQAPAEEPATPKSKTYRM